VPRPKSFGIHLVSQVQQHLGVNPLRGQLLSPPHIPPLDWQRCRKLLRPRRPLRPPPCVPKLTRGLYLSRHRPAYRGAARIGWRTLCSPMTNNEVCKCSTTEGCRNWVDLPHDGRLYFVRGGCVIGVVPHLIVARTRRRPMCAAPLRPYGLSTFHRLSRRFPSQRPRTQSPFSYSVGLPVLRAFHARESSCNACF
jgi:hypothetical protein